MLRILVRPVLVSAIVSQAASCWPSSAPFPSDTMFVEERRYELAGVRMPNGGCAAPRTPVVLAAGDRARRPKGHRMTMIRRDSCLFLVSEGYWKGYPHMEPFDPSVMAETSASAVFDATKPLPPLPPERR